MKKIKKVKKKILALIIIFGLSIGSFSAASTINTNWGQGSVDSPERVELVPGERTTLNISIEETSITDFSTINTINAGLRFMKDGSLVDINGDGVANSTDAVIFTRVGPNNFQANFTVENGNLTPTTYTADFMVEFPNTDIPDITETRTIGLAGGDTWLSMRGVEENDTIEVSGQSIKIPTISDSGAVFEISNIGTLSLEDQDHDSIITKKLEDIGWMIFENGDSTNSIKVFSNDGLDFLGDKEVSAAFGDMVDRKRINKHLKGGVDTDGDGYYDDNLYNSDETPTEENTKGDIYKAHYIYRSGPNNNGFIDGVKGWLHSKEIFIYPKTGYENWKEGNKKINEANIKVEIFHRYLGGLFTDKEPTAEYNIWNQTEESFTKLEVGGVTLTGIKPEKTWIWNVLGTGSGDPGSDQYMWEIRLAGLQLEIPDNYKVETMKLEEFKEETSDNPLYQTTQSWSWPPFDVVSADSRDLSLDSLFNQSSN